MLKKAPKPAELNHLIQAVNSGNYSLAESTAFALSKSYPKATMVWKILGVAIAEQGRMEDAIPAMQKVVALDPKDAEAHRNLATALKEVGQLNAAETHLRKAITLAPQDSLSACNLGKLLNEQGNYIDAEKNCRKAIAITYGMADAHDQLGIALLRQHKTAEAETSFNTAIMLNPEMADAYNNLGIALNEQGKFSAAEASYQQALKLNPNFANASCNLANNHICQHKLAEAEPLFLHAIALKPHYPEALNNLGNLYKDLDNIEKAIEYYRKALALDPTMMLTYSNLLLTSGYHGKLSPEVTLHEAKKFGAFVAENAKTTYSSWLCAAPNTAENTKIRIGFVSGDFRKHAVVYFLEGLLQCIDKSKFELIAYTTQPKEDEITAKIKPLFIKWQAIFDKSDQEAAALIHQDAPHILFDLSGHTAHNRLGVFAYKPAPIQATWLGYPDTTGLAEMDYILGDPYLTPATNDYQFTEQVWRLPDITWCLNPLLDFIPSTELPAITNNYITFGCFNNLVKISDSVVKTWADILNAVPTAKLYLQTSQLANDTVLAKTFQRFAAWGIAPNRLILEPSGSRENYFASYHNVDIALDPFPCPGGSTSTDTLWMGVPLITMRGNNFWSRLGETIVTNVGLTDWIAEDTSDYINKAITFSSDLPALLETRSHLRTAARSSPLFNTSKFTQQFEEALTEMIAQCDALTNGH